MSDSRPPSPVNGQDVTQQHERAAPTLASVSAPTPTAESAFPPTPLFAPAAAPAPPRRPVKRHSIGERETMNGPLYMQASNNVVLLRPLKKRKNEGPLKQFMRWFVENQIGLSFNLLALLFLAHGMPRARDYTAKFFTLSYYNKETAKYGIGRDDGHLMLFYIVLFTGLRAAAMEYVFAPFAKAQGIAKRKDITRFSEQAWLVIYYAIFWTLGLYIYVTSSSFLDLVELWKDWPNRDLGGLMKAYMLGQLAFWLQQILVINIEDRRKDHWQMFTHHIITVSLIYASYRWGFTRVGNLILVLMDVVDLVFPFAKCLKYLGYNRLCDWIFGVFMVSWIVARHIFYPIVCYSVWAHSVVHTPSGCHSGPDGNRIGPFQPPDERGLLYMFEPLWNSEGVVCYDEKVQWWFLSLLLALQGLTIMWLFLIFRVALKVLKGGSAEDTRSDDEAEDEEAIEDEEEAQPLEQEVGVEELDLKNWERRAGVKRQASSTTGVSLPGHSDRKELLGRIGCEKQVE
ncbi:TLC domain-containing protein [Podospora didyma]|uniref:TLC domain-containing protein n=1 Tax=Podospora didyma TaxID=330526 RepID=A0AAE0K9T0_9PEZI|nr:TLC domain-containing protein [Podospora didyma]